MKQRHLIVIAALLAVAFLLYLPRLLSDEEGQGTLSVSDGFAFSVSAPVTRVDVAQLADGTTIRLERGSPDWTVDGHRADMSKIETLLPTIRELGSDVIVARNPSNHEALGVSETAGRRIDVYTEAGGPYSFHLGNRDVAAGGYFVRLPGADRVFRLEGPAGGYLSRDRDGWRDRVIARVDVESVRDIMIRRPDSEIVLRRDEAGWTVDGQAADSAAVASLLELLPSLSTTGFPTDAEAAAADFSSPDVELDVFAEAEGDVTGRELTLALRLIRDEEAGDWLARRLDDDEVYRLAPFLTRRLVPEREDLLPD